MVGKVVFFKYATDSDTHYLHTYVSEWLHLYLCKHNLHHDDIEDLRLSFKKMDAKGLH